MKLDKEKVKEMALTGQYSGVQIAKEFGVSRQAVSLALKDMGISLRDIRKKKPEPKNSHPRYNNTSTRKWCNLCEIVKSPQDFSEGATYCRPCTSEYRRELKHNKIVKALEILGMKYSCEMCGYDKSTAAIDFHHIDEEEKDKSMVSIGAYALSRVVNELSKCVPLCANCHHEHHHGLVEAKKRAERLYPGSFECVSCGNDNPAVLEFDHMGNKKFNLSYGLRAFGASRDDELVDEMIKCQILCRNCHREKTFSNF